MSPNEIVSREEWLTARRALLEKEKAHMREGDRLAAERRDADGCPGWPRRHDEYPNLTR